MKTLAKSVNAAERHNMQRLYVLQAGCKLFSRRIRLTRIVIVLRGVVKHSHKGAHRKISL